MNPAKGWILCNLDELVDLDIETLAASTPKDFSFYYLDISSASEGRLALPQAETLFKEAPSRARKVVHSGDVLMSMVRPNLKAFAHFNHTNSPCIASTGFAVLTAKVDACSRFILYAILSDQVSRQIDELVIGSNYPAINSTAVRTLRILAPSLPEQTKIAEILTAVDRAIEQTEALVAKQQRIKTGLMQDLLTRGIDEHGQLRTEQTHAFKDSPLGRIPVEWETEFLDSLALRGSGHTPSKSKPDYWNGGVKWVSLADSSNLDRVYIDSTDKEISELGIQNSSAVLHPKGTVILSRDAGVGKSAIMGCDMAVSQHFMAWRCKPGRLDNAYLYYWLQKDKPKFEGVASGSTIVTIGLQFFRDYKIAAPRSVEEQSRISRVLLHADQTLGRHFESLAKLRALKTALMQDLLTGRKRVTGLLPQTQAAG
jgi:type I restriction enzyme S subunit